MRSLVALLSVLALGSAALAIQAACGGAEFVAGQEDAGPPPDAGPAPTFCQTPDAGNPQFCDDFDGPPLTAKWPSFDVTTNATLDSVTSLSFSPPKSLDSAIPASLNIAQQRARVEKTFGSASDILLRFEVHIDQVADKVVTSGGSSFLMIALGDVTVGLSANTLELSYYEDQLTDAGDTPVVSKNVLATDTVKGTWVPVVFDVNVKNATLTATVAGSSVGPDPITLPQGAGLAPVVYVGVESHNADLPLETHYDNVTITITP